MNYSFAPETFDAYDQARAAADAAKIIFGYVGKPDGAGGFLYPASGRPGKINVRLGKEVDSGFTIDAATNLTGIVDPYLLMQMERIGNELVILRPDPAAARKRYLEQVGRTSIPYHNHLQPSDGYIASDVILNGLVRPAGSALNVIVAPDVTIGLDSEYTLDLSADVPSGTNERRFALTYIAADGTPDYIPLTAAVYPSNSSIPLAEALATVLPAGAKRGFAVSLYTGQTVIDSSNTRFVDLRDLFTVQANAAAQMYDPAVDADYPETVPDDSAQALDILAARQKTASVNTTNATVTTLATLATASNVSYSVRAIVTARRTGGTAGTAGDSAGYTLFGVFKNIAGTLSQIGSTDKSAKEDQAGWDADFDVSGTSIRVRVTGAVDNNVTWVATYQIVSI